MNAAVVLAYGEKDPAVELRTDWPKPTRADGKSELLLRVLACSTAFGDVHMLSGRLSAVLKPPSFPYVPGKDVCGIVVEADANSKFKPGDCVVSSRDALAYGGMAHYVVTQEARTCLKPANVDILVAAACADSAVTALKAMEAAALKDGERVLVLGGSGGVGTTVLQLVKLASSSLLAATSTQEAMLKGLGADVVIDYRSTNWWEVEEYLQQPFDVIIDCVGGNHHFDKARKVLKSKGAGGRFVAVVGDDALPVARSIFQLLGFAGSMMWKLASRSMAFRGPAYKMCVSSTTAEYLSKVLSLIESGKVTMALESSSPYPFTAEGVKSALALQSSGHAHGKIVVRIADS